MQRGDALAAAGCTLRYFRYAAAAGTPSQMARAFVQAALVALRLNADRLAARFVQRAREICVETGDRLTEAMVMHADAAPRVYRFALPRAQLWRACVLMLTGRRRRAQALARDALNASARRHRTRDTRLISRYLALFSKPVS